jgi:hypothetical protein
MRERERMKIKSFVEKISNVILTNLIAFLISALS